MKKYDSRFLRIALTASGLTEGTPVYTAAYKYAKKSLSNVKSIILVKSIIDAAVDAAIITADRGTGMPESFHLDPRKNPYRAFDENVTPQPGDSVNRNTIMMPGDARYDSVGSSRQRQGEPSELPAKEQDEDERNLPGHDFALMGENKMDSEPSVEGWYDEAPFNRESVIERKQIGRDKGTLGELLNRKRQQGGLSPRLRAAQSFRGENVDTQDVFDSTCKRMRV